MAPRATRNRTSGQVRYSSILPGATKMWPDWPNGSCLGQISPYSPERRNSGEIFLSTETEARWSRVPQPVLLEDDFIREQERSSTVVKLNQVHPPT